MADEKLQTAIADNTCMMVNSDFDMSVNLSQLQIAYEELKNKNLQRRRSLDVLFNTIVFIWYMIEKLSPLMGVELEGLSYSLINSKLPYYKQLIETITDTELNFTYLILLACKDATDVIGNKFDNAPTRYKLYYSILILYINVTLVNMNLSLGSVATTESSCEPNLDTVTHQ